MNSITSNLQSQSQTSSPPFGALDDMLKAKGVLSDKAHETQEAQEESASQSMTIANFSPQSVLMSQGNGTSNALLQSVMEAASNSGAETNAERSAFGKQAAASMMQGLEQEAFEEGYANLLEGLRTDIEEATEQAMEEATEGTPETTVTQSPTTPVEAAATTAGTTGATTGENATATSKVSSTTAATAGVAPAPSVDSTQNSAGSTDANASTEGNTQDAAQSVDVYV